MEAHVDKELRGSLAAGMTDGEAERLFACLERRELAAGEKLFEYGMNADRLYYLREGKLIASLDVDGRILILGEIHPGRWLGEVNLIDQGTASATVTAVADSVLYSLCHDSLIGLRDHHPRVATALLQNITKDLAARVRRTSAGLIEQVNDHEFRVAKPAERENWFGGALSWLFSGGA
ncbi:MAG: CRP-like cAMP-binding protein [Myxococcota bacterium]|jgi:CRP-like cAMP-binding protein